ncbi:MAG: RHS repeat-associated core domain-containing protein, partial [Flavobacteriia bacterium]|nr:RHS repeat-associated core domain-containing protein [Flavobacteriia bacterium]
KTVIEETATPEVRIEVDYLDGFQYAGEMLNFFPTAEGYVRATPTGNITPGAPPTGYAYSYVFNYTDHLGNVWLSYSMDHLTGKLKILEENHYYPFGLRHEVYLTGSKLDFSRNPGDGIEPEPGLPPVLDYVTRMEYQYKYNGKEFQDELGLNFYDYGARNYDPTIGRWNVTDPMAPKYFSHSPYTYALNNPVYFIDPDGMQVGPGDDIFNEDEPIVLETAVLTAKAPEKKPKTESSSVFSWGFLPRLNATRGLFGADGEKSIHGAYRNMLSPENRGGYIKMQLAKREGEWFAVGVFAVVLAPEVALYGSVIAETKFGLYVLKTAGKIAIDATAQYAITGDVNWGNAVAGSVLPGKAGTALSPIMSEGADVLQNNILKDKPVDYQKSSAKVIGGYLGNLSGVGTSAVSSDWSSKVGSFIFSNGIQSFQTQGNSEIINSRFK